MLNQLVHGLLRHKKDLTRYFEVEIVDLGEDESYFLQ